MIYINNLILSFTLCHHYVYLALGYWEFNVTMKDKNTPFWEIYVQVGSKPALTAGKVSLAQMDYSFGYAVR